VEITSDGDPVEGDPAVLTPHFLTEGVQMCIDPPLSSATLLYVACYPDISLSVLPTVAELCMHVNFCR